jgi:hypothetical protein
MLTPKDIRNPKRKSGYDHVGCDVGAGAAVGLFRAQAGGGRPGHARVSWRGTRRTDALEAAQDYCDYINNGSATTPATLRTAGHKYTVKREPVPSDVEAARGVLRDFKAQQEGQQGHVYLILEDNPGGAIGYGKIGYSVNPRKRVAEVQTGNPRHLKLYAFKPGTEADERSLHAKYIKHNVLQEWFHVTKELLLEWDATEVVK